MSRDLDITLEMARLVRECEERVRVKIASRQLGEAWVGLEDNNSNGRNEDNGEHELLPI